MNPFLIDWKLHKKISTTVEKLLLGPAEILISYNTCISNKIPHMNVIVCESNIGFNVLLK